MHAAEVNSTPAEREQKRYSFHVVDQRPSAPYWFDSINTSSLFLLLRLAGIKNNTVAGLKRGFQIGEHALALHLGNLAQIHAALFAEAAMHQLLVVDPAQPSGVEASGEGHFHFVPGRCAVGNR